MSTIAGHRQYMVQAQSDALRYRLVDQGAAVALSGTQQVQILDVDGSEIVAKTSTGVTDDSGSVVIYTITWAAATYPLDTGYSAVWTLTDGASTWTRKQYFEVVLRRFESQLIDADFTAAHPYLSAENVASNFAPYLNASWEEITNYVTSKTPQVRRRDSVLRSGSRLQRYYTPYAGNIFYPSQFRLAHERLCLAHFFFATQFDGDERSEERAKYDELRRLAYNELDNAIARVDFDTDSDALLDTDEMNQTLNGVELVR